ncbi:AfsR/SARP family transcriptional regulator [Kutzneria buriramensis]|uniref:AfsR/SARP family transcriptional regulator n=1 Tax=Kutzneria buriramensis TaxID=1045776 RepID=UPI0036D3FA0B
MSGYRDGQELALGSPQQRTVLACLLSRDDKPVDIDELIVAIWGEDPPKAALGAARTYVSRLRTILEPDHRDYGGPRLLVSVGTAYILRMPPGSTDVQLVEQDVAAANAARLAGDLSRAHRLLRRAEQRWRGVPLTGLVGPFAEHSRDQLVQRRLTILEKRFELDLILGEAAVAAADIDPLIAAHPLRESLRALQMQALYQCGRRAEALSVFTDVRRVLTDEFGIDPGPRLTEIHERILRSDTGLLPAPSISSTAPAPAQLPADIADFTGRSEFVATLRRQLTATPGTAAPICVVSGIGGAGKTALSVHVAHAVRDQFPDGQLYVDLAGQSPRPVAPRDVLGHFLRSLGVEQPSIPDDQSARAALFRTLLANRKVLLLLDNARDSSQITPLLPGCSGCAVLVTSRARLAGTPATGVDVSTFEPNDAVRLLGKLIGGQRVAAEPESAQQLAALCGHLPLAIRIAACRLQGRPGMRIADIVRRLADERRRLPQLRSGGLDIRSTFQLGYDQLDSTLARAFRILAVPGIESVPLRWAAALLDLPEPDTEDVLDRLIASGMVQATGTGGCRFHDLLRVFASDLGAEIDSDDDRRAALSRLLSFPLTTVSNAYRTQRPGHSTGKRRLGAPPGSGIEFSDFSSAHSRFERERGLMRAVLDQCLRQAPDRQQTVAHVVMTLDPLSEWATRDHESSKAVAW